MGRQSVIDIYRALAMFLKSDGYRKDLEIELEKSNPGFIKDIDKRIIDMEKSDHGIVIAGETSAGKSTLLNMILQKNIFIGHTMESTSTICKIRNLDRVRIITKRKDEQIEEPEIDLTDRCDLTSERGVELLRTHLEKLTDKTSSENSVEFECVDVGFPIPFLKGNAILVDTPGIGGTGDVTPKLMEYLPNAVSFIFVINIDSAGGMQSDRLPVILHSINETQIKNEMPCFDPEDVIFITNKWDSIRSQFDVEKEREELWEKIKIDLKKKWPNVKDSHIFRMNVLDVDLGADNENTSTKEFKKFKDILFANVEKANDIRIKRHFGFLQALLKNVSKGLNARLELGKKSAKEQHALKKIHLQSLQKLKMECKTMRQTVPKKIDKAIEVIVNECFVYMSSESGKRHILNPTCRTPMIDVPWTSVFFIEEIKSRINIYIEAFLQSPDVSQKFVDIRTEIIDFYKRVSGDLSSFEADWACVKKDEFSNRKSMVDPFKTFDEFPFALKISMIAVSIVITAAVATVCLLLFNPVFVPALMFTNTVDVKREVIDSVYNANIASVRSQIQRHLEERCGNALNLLVNKVSNFLLPNRIHFLETMIQQLSDSREEILASIQSISFLRSKLNAMRTSAEDLQSTLMDEMQN